MEYKLNQSSATTAASDRSLSSTLMPSNCLWRPLPVCSSAGTPTQPHRSQRCPSAPSPLPVSITAGFLSHMSCFITGRPRVASVFLNRVKSSAAQVCGGPGDARRSLEHSPPLSLLCVFNVPARILDWFSRYNRPPSVPVEKFARRCFLRSECGPAFTGTPKTNPNLSISTSVSDQVSSTATLDLQIH